MATVDMQEKMTDGKRETTPSPGVFIESLESIILHDGVSLV